MACEAILLVGSNLSSVRSRLLSKGHRVCVAYDTREAAAILEVFLPQIILADLPDQELRLWIQELQSDPTTRGIAVSPLADP